MTDTTPRSSRSGARKIGADMANALLYAAFAVITLLSVLFVYDIVEFNNKKKETISLITTVTTESRLLLKQERQDPSVTTLNQKLADSGVLPIESVGSTINLPYGGQFFVDGRPSLNGDKWFQTYMYWPVSSPKAVQLCKTLAGFAEGLGEEEAIQDFSRAQSFYSGPMGSNYAVSFDNCDAQNGFVYLAAVYNDT